jgi:hypothetical protein
LKKILPVFLFLTASLCNAQVINYSTKHILNWQTYHLKGKVSSTTEFNYKSYILKDEVYEIARNYKFDIAGQCLDKIILLTAGGANSHYSYGYDKNGNRIEDKDFTESGHWRRTVNKYDLQGNQIECIGYDTLGRIADKDEYTYDKHGNYTAHKHSGDRSYSETNTFVYDGSSRLVSAKNVTTDGDYKNAEIRYSSDTLDESWRGSWGNGHVQTVFNKNKQMVMYRSVGPEDGFGQPFENTYQYDSAGNQTGIRQTRNGVVDKFPYSERFEYEYDKNGNWIKRTTTTLDGKPMESVERKIEYY